MSGPGKKYEVGYKRPPKATRWKKGQSGRPGRRSSPRSDSIIEMIDALLLAPVKITLNGEPKQVPALEAILERLWMKGIAGDRQATDVYMRYQELALRKIERKVEIIFTDSDYTTALAAQPPSEGPDDER
jgi:hypothetical protein